ncbi:MAG TPA: hypothetical protein VHA13_00275 [Gammaproteobacteria bacterium]|nr:hypothetical protein [Gammaproteobacteria bacterium]
MNNRECEIQNPIDNKNAKSNNTSSTSAIQSSISSLLKPSEIVKEDHSSDSDSDVGSVFDCSNYAQLHARYLEIAKQQNQNNPQGSVSSAESTQTETPKLKP